MGEIFEQRQPTSALEWTGERLVSGVGGQVEIEHLHRYMLARDFCRGLDVLDIASGEGYGTALLAQVANHATGVEVSADAAGHASAQYGGANLRYLQGDARNIPLADQSVDIVVSFETIEHFYEHDAFLSEVRRVLRPGGRFLVSSPDRDIYSPPGSVANPHHKRELSRSEFVTLLDRFFAHSRLLSQRPMLGSALLADDGAASPTTTFEKRGPGFFERSDGVSRPPYLIALASDADLPPLPNSIYIADSEIGPLMARAAAHDGLQTALADTLHRAEAAETAFHASRAEIDKCMREAAQERDAFASRLASAQAELEAVRGASTTAAEIAANRDAWVAEREELEAKYAAATADRAALVEDLRQACMLRDTARIALRRAGVFAENGWKTRLAVAETEIKDLTRRTIEAEQSARDWNFRYHALRGRLEGFLHRSGLFSISRLVPRPFRRLVRDRLFARRGA